MGIHTHTHTHAHTHIHMSYTKHKSKACSCDFHGYAADAYPFELGYLHITYAICMPTHTNMHKHISYMIVHAHNCTGTCKCSHKYFVIHKGYPLLPTTIAIAQIIDKLEMPAYACLKPKGHMPEG